MVKQLLPSLLFLMAFNYQATAQEPPPELFFDCPVPVGANGYINIYKMISALSGCAGLNPELLLDDPIKTEIIDFGSYEIHSSGNENSTSQQATVVEHVSWDREIQLREDLIIGFRAYFSGVIEGDNEQIKILVIRPEHNRSGEQELVDEVSYKTLVNGQLEMVLFHISSKDEMMPGIWTFEIHNKGRILASQRLKLVL